MKYEYYHLNQIEPGIIFSLVGTYGKPFLRLKNGYADMKNGRFYEAHEDVEQPERCRLLDVGKLAKKYEKNITWIDAWKASIEKMAMKDKL